MIIPDKSMFLNMTQRYSICFAVQCWNSKKNTTALFSSLFFFFFLIFQIFTKYWFFFFWYHSFDVAYFNCPCIVRFRERNKRWNKKQYFKAKHKIIDMSSSWICETRQTFPLYLPLLTPVSSSCYSNVPTNVLCPFDCSFVPNTFTVTFFPTAWIVPFEFVKSSISFVSLSYFKWCWRQRPSVTDRYIKMTDKKWVTVLHQRPTVLR